MSSRRCLSSAYPSVILGALALALGACSADPDDDGGPSLPEFGGNPAAGGAPSGVAPVGVGGAANPGLGGQPAGVNGEQPPGNIPISGGAGNGGNAAPVAPAGTGGAAPVSPAGGAGGVGAGGAAALGGAGGAAAIAGAGGAAAIGGAGGAPAQPPPVADPFPAPDGPGCGPAAFFCEDFEALAVGTAAQNDAWRPDGNVSIDGVASEGARALRLQPGGGQFARIALNNFSAPNNSLFGRMFLRVEALPSSPNFAHWVVVEATGNGSSERVRPLGGQFIDLADRGIRTNFWGIGSDGGPTGDWTHWDNAAPVEAQSAVYQCIEWRMNGADSAIDVWIDGEFKPSMSVSRDDTPTNASFVFPTFNNMTIGWGVFQGGTTPGQFDVHIDDIVLSSQRAGCN